MGNPLLSGVSVVAALAVITLGVQTVRIHFIKKENAVLTIRVQEYKASLAEEKRTAKAREAAIMKDVARERKNYEDLQKLLEEIDRDTDAPLPDIIWNSIDRLQ